MSFASSSVSSSAPSAPPRHPPRPGRSTTPSRSTTGIRGSPDTGFGIAHGARRRPRLRRDRRQTSSDAQQRQPRACSTSSPGRRSALAPDPALPGGPRDHLRRLRSRRATSTSTNSTSGSVSCFTPALAPVATIPLPRLLRRFPYPFGLLVSPDQTRVYVTTLGGCGDVHVDRLRSGERDVQHRPELVRRFRTAAAARAGGPSR